MTVFLRPQKYGNWRGLITLLGAQVPSKKQFIAESVKIVFPLLCTIMSVLGYILILVITLLASAFFSGLEIAFISANKLRIELKSNQGHRWAQTCAKYFRSPSKFISTILVGNNIAIVIYGIYMEGYLTEHFGDYLPDSSFSRLLVITVASTALVLLVAEFIPKIVFSLNPNAFLRSLIYPFQVFAWICRPLVLLVLWLAKRILKLALGKEFTEESPAFSRVDLDHYITESQTGNPEEDNDVDTDIIRNALDFGNVKIRECMVPRTSVHGVALDDGIEALEKLFVETGHSKLCIYRETIDNIIGYVHHLDMLKKPKDIASVLIPILITNESKPAHDMLKEFTFNRKSIAVVVDEFGGTAGIVTTEDIIEEIFGEIQDEHDDEDHIIEEKLNDLEYSFSASLEIDYLNETYDLHIPEGDYETLGGYIINNYESIPEEGQQITVDQFEFMIMHSENNRIETVNMRIIPE
jgi:putative hemolysin